MIAPFGPRCCLRAAVCALSLVVVSACDVDPVAEAGEGEGEGEAGEGEGEAGEGEGEGEAGEGEGEAGEGEGEGEIPDEPFSFFVTSMAGLQNLSGSDDGFGGDLRFGETGAQAGLKGADRICAALAETSMPGAGNKTWRAFLSITDGGNGAPVHAIDRIGDGPWFDRLGRTFALTKADLLHDRPSSADLVIKNDFPNEFGVPNHAPDPTQGQVDNHDMLTGSDSQGRLYSQSGTCADWTGNSGTEGRPRVGHSWPRGGGGGGPGGGSGANWMSSLDESGCAPGGSVIERGPPILSEDTVGSGGGYGGFYCFALEP